VRGCPGHAVTGPYGRPAAGLGRAVRTAPDGARRGAVPHGRPARPHRRPEPADHRPVPNTPRDGHGGAACARCDVATEHDHGG